MSATAAEGQIRLPLDASGQRSSLALGRETVAAALRAAGGGNAYADAARDERLWRHRYPQHVVRLVAAGLRSADAAHAIADAGLHHLRRHVHWVDGGTEVPLDAVRAWPPAPGSGFETLTLHGRSAAAPTPWAVSLNGQQLRGGALREQIVRWVDSGIIEPGAGLALQRCLDHPEWFDLSDRRFVLLGAGSEAGPLGWLLQWRADVVAVDLPRPGLWQRLATLAEAGNGTLRVPLRRQRQAGEDWTARAGADLLREASAVHRWVAGFDGPLDIAAHGYADGERHLRLALAMDLVQGLALERPGSSLAWLATPTDAFAVPASTAAAARRAWRARPWPLRGAQALARAASAGRFFLPSVTALHATDSGQRYGIVDSLIPEQGPNYALAKRLQQWRAVQARQRGVRASMNVAPSTLTASVLKNRAFAAAFAGARSFGVEPFEPATTTALMAALWVHDLRCDEAAANPARTLGHPYELFMDSACHGGLWRCAYRARSALPFAALGSLLGFGRGS